jgi:hypothetical protein
VLIFLLLILDAHRFFQLLRLEPSEAAPSMPGTEVSVSDSEGLSQSAGRLPEGLVGRGEKVPWLQGPSCASSRKSSVPPSKDVDSVACCLLGPAT